MVIGVRWTHIPHLKVWNSISTIELSVAYLTVGPLQSQVIRLLKHSPSGSINSITCTWCSTDLKAAVHNPASFLFPLSAKERWGLSIYGECKALRKNKSRKFEPMTVDNGVLGIHFGTWMLLMTIWFVGKLVTGFPSTGNVDLRKVWVLGVSYRLLAFICKSLLGGWTWQELAYLFSLHLRSLPISCITHSKRPVFWNTPLVLKHSSLT